MNISEYVSNENRSFIIKPSPSMFFLDLTEKCNLKCWFCYNNVYPQRKKHASFEDIKAILSSMIASGCKEVIYLGGEPTIHPSFFEILQFANEIGYEQQCFITNGQIMDSDFVKRLKDIPNIFVGISLHSYKKNIHNQICGSSYAFEKAVVAIMLLNEYNIKWYSQTSLVKENYTDLLEFHRFLMKLGGSSRMDFSRMIESCNNSSFLSSEEYIEIFREINKMDTDKLPVRIEAFPRCWLKKVAFMNNLDYNKLKKSIRPCYNLISQLSVDIYGNARLCPTGGMTLGNIIKDGLNKVWLENENVIEFRTFEWLPIQCKSCGEILYCVGGCKRTLCNDKYNPDKLIQKEGFLCQ